mgnify:CR=1 FL=1
MTRERTHRRRPWRNAKRPSEHERRCVADPHVIEARDVAVPAHDPGARDRQADGLSPPEHHQVHESDHDAQERNNLNQTIDGGGPHAIGERRQILATWSGLMRESGNGPGLQGVPAFATPPMATTATATGTRSTAMGTSRRGTGDVWNRERLVWLAPLGLAALWARGCRPCHS